MITAHLASPADVYAADVAVRKRFRGFAQLRRSLHCNSIRDDAHVRILRKQHVQDLFQVARAAADESVSRRGKVCQRLRRRPFHDRHIADAELFHVRARERDGVRFFFDRVHVTAGSLQRAFHGHGSAAGPDIPDDRAFRQLQFRQRDAADLLFCHRNVRAGERIVRDAVCHRERRPIRVFDEQNAQRVVGTGRQFVDCAGRDLFVVIAEPFADIGVQAAQTGFLQPGKRVDRAALAAQQRKDSRVLANAAYEIRFPSVQADRFYVLPRASQLRAEI